MAQKLRTEQHQNTYTHTHTPAMGGENKIIIQKDADVSHVAMLSKAAATAPRYFKLL